MKKFIKNIAVSLLFLFVFISSTNAIEIDNISYKKSIALWEKFKIDISNIVKDLEEEYSNKIYIEWDTRGASTKTWNIYEKSFEEAWEKIINLNIYDISNNERELIVSQNLEVFVYKQSISLIIDSSIKPENIEDFIGLAKESFVYVYNKVLDKKEIENENILNLIKKYQMLSSNDLDYIWVWWDKEFIFDILSKLNKDILDSDYDKKINLSLISTFNIKVLENYLNNFLAKKIWINKAILFEDISKWQLIKEPQNIDKLEQEMSKNEYNYINLNTKWEINRFMFISNFVNILSSKWFSTQSIYLIILIPFLLVWISIFKHFIWLSTIWIIIPISLTIMFFKVWAYISILMILIILFINLIVSKIINKYTLLYTPKVSFLAIINIITIIITINILDNYSAISTSISDIIFIILFLIISERLISIIVSKEFREYKSNFLNTILFSIISFLFFNINIIKVFLLAYPEVIILLIPFSFLLWRFTWLRITEYFRFKEVIKNIEE